MITKYLLTGGEIIPINVEFEDQFQYVFRRDDICGKFTIKKGFEIYNIFDTIQEAIEFQSKKVEKQIIDLQNSMKIICENHSIFLKKYKI